MNAKVKSLCGYIFPAMGGLFVTYLYNVVDGIFVGPYDLSVALGQPGRFDTEEFQNAVARILAAAKEAGKRAIMYTVDPAQAPEFFQRGFDAVTLGTDLKLMISQLRPVVKRAKEVMPVK